MAHLLVALFLFVFGLNILIGNPIPNFIIALLAIIAAVALVFDHFRVRVRVTERVDTK
jgi:hypothetical protein